VREKIIVTGATGFLGHYVIQELVAQNYEVIAVGRNKKQLVFLEEKYGITPLVLDLSDREQVLNLWPEGAAVCIHCAALSTIYGPYEEFYQANVEATKTVVEASIAKQVKRFVFVSSPSIYAKCKDDFNIKELDLMQEAPPTPYLNYYIQTKIEAEQLLYRYQEEIELVIVRPRGLFGIGDTSIFPRLMAVNKKIGIPLFRKGQGNIMDMTCVENVAYALRLCIEVKGIRGSIFNITNDEPVPFKSLIERIFQYLGEEVRYRNFNEQFIYKIAGILERVHYALRLKKEPLLTRYTVSILAYSQTLDISTAKEKLGYQPIMTMDEGIQKYITDYKKKMDR
jgi:nucleoside-diphosphate-sugar epimerase